MNSERLSIELELINQEIPFLLNKHFVKFKEAIDIQKILFVFS
jgi:hypothetical protein